MGGFGGFSTYFPAADAQEELQNITLLLLLKLLDVCDVTSSVIFLLVRKGCRSIDRGIVSRNSSGHTLECTHGYC